MSAALILAVTFNCTENILGQDLLLPFLCRWGSKISVMLVLYSVMGTFSLNLLAVTLTFYDIIAAISYYI